MQDQAGIHADVLVNADARNAIHRNGCGAFGIDRVRAVDIFPLPFLRLVIPARFSFSLEWRCGFQ
ncbi:MAG: hypothetical protein LBU43_08955 [Candidatus Accumulibacter sp.]|nr:hypothetical protein [Accumulibacter sp.]